MSDRPNNAQDDLTPQDSGASSGWRTPEQGTEAASSETSAAEDVQSPAPEAPQQAVLLAGGWRAPSESVAAAAGQSASKGKAWRVPTLPRELDPQPRASGQWHLPATTTISADDESVVISDEAPSEDAIPIEGDAATELGVLPHDALASEAEADGNVLPLDPLSHTGETGTEAGEDLEEDEDEEEGDRFSMSQLIAIASLAEKPEAAIAIDEDAAAADPAEYARQQIEKLRAAGAAAAAEPEPEPAPQAEQAEVAVSETAGLSETEVVELEKFRAAEARIKSLREEFRQGRMTREELTEALKKQMVLDDNNSWWMMGVESDNWYHHENNAWVLKKPAVLAKAAGSAPPVAPVSPSPAPVIAQEDEMPLPQQVPTRDLDATMVGTAAINLASNLPDTMPNIALDQPADANAYTQVNPAFQATVPSNATVVSAPIGDYVPPVAIPSPAPVVTGPAIPSYEEAVAKAQQNTVRRIIIAAAVLVGVLLLSATCGIVALLTTYQNVLSPYTPGITALANYEPAFQTARIYAADNTVIATLIGQGDRQPVALNEVSPYFLHAVLSIEDPQYYANAGFDAGKLVSGFVQNVTAGAPGTTGGITEQIACNLVIQNCEPTPENQLRIFVVASEISRTYDANFILNLYINEIFFGNQSYGVESAGEFYFNTPARDLNRAQSALLAGLIEAPATFDPIVNRGGAFERMNAVLNRQAEVGCIQLDFDPYRGEPFCITSAELVSGQVILEKARVEAANYRPRENQNRYPHFVNYVQAQVEQYYGTSEMFRRGFQIYTTLNPRIQDTAQAALIAGVANGTNAGVNNGAVLVAEPGTGAIRAMVGSSDFNNRQIDGEVNNVFTWQPSGDAIQPIIYTAALEGQTNPTTGVFEYMTPATVLWNVPTTYNTTPPFAPQNVNGAYTGPTSIRFALGNSYAVTSAKAYEFIGDQHFVDTSNRMGINFLQDAIFGLGASQGTNSVRLYDMVEAYGTLAANGQRAPLTAIARVTDNQGNEIATPERAAPSQQIQPQVAFLINSILADDVARSSTFGLNSALNLQSYAGRVAVKTGTSTGNQDLWTVGYSSNLVVGVWAGSHNNTNTNGSAQGIAVPVWNAVMNAALQGTNPAFQQPSGIVQAQVCALTGALYDPNVTQNCSAVRTELFVQNAPPLTADQGFVNTLNIDSWSGLLANQYCPDNTIAGRFLNVSDPSAVSWLSSGAGQAFAAQNGLTGLTGLTPPSACTISSQNPVIALNGPTNGQTLQGTIQFLGTVQAFNFSQYTIELAPQNAPTSFTVIVGPNNTQVQNGALGTFDTTRVPNGVYTFRLAVYNTSNGYAYRTAQVTINNPAPTPTPTVQFIQPTVPPFIQPTFPVLVATPLPFDPFTSGGPTPTINFGG